MLLDNELRSKNLLNQRNQNTGFNKNNVLNFPQNYSGYDAKNNASFGNAATDAGKKAVETTAEYIAKSEKDGLIKASKQHLESWTHSPLVQEWWNTIGFPVSAVSVIGFSIGGAGLIHEDKFQKGKLKKGHSGTTNNKQGNTTSSVTEANNKNASSVAAQKELSVNKPIESSQFNQITPKSLDIKARLAQMKKEAGIGNTQSFGSAKKDKTEDKKSGGEGEYGYIEPQTEFGKVGMNAGKVAMAVSGVAGMMTGIACRSPLMAFGEFLGNIVAGSIIETPIGYGLMSIGMASLFAGRAFEHDPAVRLNEVELANKKGLIAKAGYIAGNIGKCIAETGKVMKEVATHTINLCKKDTREEAKHFFKYRFFNLRSSAIELTQKIQADGKCVVGKTMRGDKHRLHTSAGLLALSGIVLIGEGILEKVGIFGSDKKKAEKARKACFNGAKVGQFADNAGIAIWGAERIAKGSLPMGLPILASGVTALVGAPKVDEAEGKGMIWAALGFFFTMLTMERGFDLSKSMKARKAIKETAKKYGVAFKEQADNMVRKTVVDWSRAIGADGKQGSDLNKRVLNNILYTTGGYEERLRKQTSIDKLKNQAQKELKEHKNPVYRQIPKFYEESERILKAPYSTEQNTEWFIGEVAKSKDKEGKQIFSKEFIDFLKTKNAVQIETQLPKEKIEPTLEAVHNANLKFADKDDYKNRVLPKIIAENSQNDNPVGKIAKKVLDKMQGAKEKKD